MDVIIINPRLFILRLKQETASPEPREPELMHHNIGGRDFILDSRYTELKYVPYTHVSLFLLLSSWSSIQSNAYEKHVFLHATKGNWAVVPTAW